MGMGGTVVKRLLDCWVVRKEHEALFTIVTIRRIILLLLKVVNVRVILCDHDIPPTTCNRNAIPNLSCETKPTTLISLPQNEGAEPLAAQKIPPS